MNLFDVEDSYVFDHCTRLLVRTNQDARSSFLGHLDGSDAARFSEPWRLPIVDRSETVGENRVTFVWSGMQAPQQVQLLCTATGLHQLVDMRRVGESPWYTVGVRVPHGQVHLYRFKVDGAFQNDAINPQTGRRADGAVWSRFFTDFCRTRLTLETGEWQLLDRLTDHILPFRTERAQKWLNSQQEYFYGLDQSVGAVNYIDKMLAREEAHRLTDYRVGLAVIEDLLRARNPVVAPHEQEPAAYSQLFSEIAAWTDGQTIPQWDHERYGNPKAFMALLRRHTWTGAFCHPSYGGNVEAIGWRYLQEHFQASPGGTAFDWRRAIEPPLGRDEEYLG